MSDLVERLRRACDPHNPMWRHDRNAAGMAAASLIERQAALISLARETLIPLAVRCETAVRPDDADGAGVTVRTEHLRCAAATLAKLETEHVTD